MKAQPWRIEANRDSSIKAEVTMSGSSNLGSWRIMAQAQLFDALAIRAPTLGELRPTSRCSEMMTLALDCKNPSEAEFPNSQQGLSKHSLTRLAWVLKTLHLGLYKRGFWTGGSTGPVQLQPTAQGCTRISSPISERTSWKCTPPPPPRIEPPESHNCC